MFKLDISHKCLVVAKSNSGSQDSNDDMTYESHLSLKGQLRYRYCHGGVGWEWLFV